MDIVFEDLKALIHSRHPGQTSIEHLSARCKYGYELSIGDMGWIKSRVETVYFEEVTPRRWFERNI